MTQSIERKEKTLKTILSYNYVASKYMEKKIERAGE
jgi:hypothetical protein